MSFMPCPKRLAIAVTFHFREPRLVYLRAIAKHFHSLADEVLTFIVTNRQDDEAKEHIRLALDGTDLEYRIIVPHLIGHPVLLTWTHRDVFRYLMENDNEVTHFLYVEDDICVRSENIIYWMSGRELLRSSGQYPSFVRYEQREIDGERYSSDAMGSADPRSLPTILFKNNYAFVNLPWPYQGMYLLDREQMAEHLYGPSSHPNFGSWNIQEKAAQGLTFAAVPQGFTSRNLVGYRVDFGQIDENCLVHHLPNNYIDMPGTLLGKTPINGMVSPPLTAELLASSAGRREDA